MSKRVNGEPFVVPLSPETVQHLEALEALTPGREQLLAHLISAMMHAESVSYACTMRARWDLILAAEADQKRQPRLPAVETTSART